MKSHKNDLYEVRPLLIGLAGLSGLVAPFIFGSDFKMTFLSVSCSILLFFCAHKIVHWRKSYRRHFRLF